MDYITLTERILALATSAFALWNGFRAARPSEKGVAPGSPHAAKELRETPDWGIYAIALLVSAVAALSLSSALLTQKELLTWAAAPYVVIAAALLFAAACTLPLRVRGDLRHLLWICLAGLIPVILAVSRSGTGKRSVDSSDIWILLCVWLFLASALAVYSMSKGAYTAVQRKNWVKAAGVLLLVCSVALGVFLANGVKEDERAHSQLEGPAADVQVKIDHLTRPERMLFYQLASEAALAPYYQDVAGKARESRPPTFEDEPKGLDWTQWRGQLEANLHGLPTKEQVDLFRKRLNGVHPVPKAGEQRVAVNLPGIDTKKRFDYFNNELIFNALTQYEVVEAAYLAASGGSYGSLAERLKAAAGSPPSLAQTIEGLKKAVKSTLHNIQHGQEDQDVYSEVEAEIFGLPPEQSAKLLQNYYKKLALDGFRDEGNKDITGPVTSFEAMDDRERAAFLVFATPRDRIDLLALLYDHRTEDAVTKLPRRASQETAQLLDAFRKTGSVSGDDETQSFIKSLADVLATDEHKATLVSLLGTLDPATPVLLVFREKPLELANQLSKNLTEKESTKAVAVMRDALGEGVKEFQRRLPDAGQTGPVLEEFLKRTEEEREALLHNLSLDIYGLGGDNTLPGISQTIDEAGQNGALVGMGVATLFSLPGLLIVAFFGAMFGRHLLSLSFNADKLIKGHKSVLEEQAQPTAQWGFVGRAHLMEKLQRLSLRSSGTVGLVGRRGIGKTRMLRELLQEYNRAGAVSVWLDCPTSMSQEDFVQSISERVVDIVESRFATFAGIPNQARRRLDRRVVSSTTIAVGVLVMLYVGVVFSLSDMSPTLIMPTLLIAGIGVGVLFVRISGSAVSSRINRGAFEPGTSAFEWQNAYEAVTRMADRLQARRLNPGQGFKWSESPLPVMLMAAPVAILLLLFFVYLLAEYTVETIVIGAVACVFLAWRLMARRELAAEAGFSAVSFTFRFREFVMEITDRIRAGALGKQVAESDVTLVVVVDELDKIVDRDELKSFIRVVKTVFDIRGTRFFLSISQDAYRDLVLGAALGKNEFDSSFDHIELIGPMELDAARDLVHTYLHGLGQAEPDDSTTNVIAALGKGVPRDILRRCDTAIRIAAEKPESLADRLLQAERENLLAGLQYLAGLSDRVAKVFTEARPSLGAILDLIADEGTSEQLARILSENFVYVHLLETPEPAARGGLVERYYGFLYSIPTLTTDSIRSALSVRGVEVPNG